MSLADDILSKYSTLGGGYKPPSPSDDVLAKHDEDEGYFSKGLHAVGSVLGAPKAGIDYLYREAARAQGAPVQDDATFGSMLRAGVGLSQGDEGYGGKLAGRALEFVGDVASDPLTYAMGGLGGVVRAGKTAQAALGGASRLAPEALGALVPESLAAASRAARIGRFADPVQKGASAAFTGLMGAGAFQEGAHALERFQREGFTPQVAEETLGTALSGLGAVAGAAHFLPGKKATSTPGDPVLAAIRGASDTELASRAAYYAKNRMAREAQMVAFEQTKRRDGKPQQLDTFDEEFSQPKVEPPIVKPSALFEQDVAAEAASRVPWAKRETLDPEATEWFQTVTPETLSAAVDRLEEVAGARAATPTNRLSDRGPGPLEGDALAVAGGDRSGVAATEAPTLGDAGIQATALAPDVGEPSKVIPFKPTKAFEALGQAAAKVGEAPLPPAFILLRDQALEAGLETETVLEAIKTTEGRAALRNAMQQAVSEGALRPRSFVLPEGERRMASTGGKLFDDANAPPERPALVAEQQRAIAENPEAFAPFQEAAQVAADMGEVRTARQAEYEAKKKAARVESRAEAERLLTENEPQRLPLVPEREGQPAEQVASPAAPERPSGRTETVTVNGEARTVELSPVTAKEQAAQKPSGDVKYSAAEHEPTFYSQLRRVVDLPKTPRAASGADYFKYLSDPNKGIKAEELKWTGLDDFLRERAGQKVTKAEIQDFLDQNRVEVKEVTLGKDARPDIETRLDEINDRMEPLSEEYAALQQERTVEQYTAGTEPSQFIARVRANRDAMHALERERLNLKNERAQKATPKFAQYQEPGGENYRELLLILPERSPSTFRGGHYDEPNVLAHVRFNDRVDAQGKKVLFLEEIQSDWAQKGRREGFDRIPAAPFVGKTEAWTELVLKRMLRYAAENGYDRVAWTPGEMQAKRYDLSKQIDNLRVAKDGDSYHILGVIRGGDAHDFGSHAATNLPEVVGKDLANRIVRDFNTMRPGEEPLRVYEGPDLKVGGEGMKGYYDQIVPSVASKLGKKFGAKVGEAQIQTGTGEGWSIGADATVYRDRRYAESVARERGLNPTAVHAASSGIDTEIVSALDVTPEMRGPMPLFKAGQIPAEATSTLRENVTSRFKKHVKSISYDEDGSLRVRFKDGLGDYVFREGVIEYDPGAFKRGRGREMFASEQIVGSAQRLDNDMLIRLREGVGPETLGHEELHGLLALGRLKPYEIDALFREHGFDPRKFKDAGEAQTAFRATEERVADMVGNLIRERLVAEKEGRTPAQPSWFNRMWSYLKRLWSAVSQRTTAEAVGERIASGEVYKPKGLVERGAEIVGAAVRGQEPLLGEKGPQFSVKGGPPEPVQQSIPDLEGPKPPASVGDMVREGYISSLVSGPPTHLVNPVANIGEAGARVVESFLAGPVDKALTAVSGGPRTRFSGEALEQVKGGIKSVPGAFRVLGEGLRGVLKSEGAIPGKAGKVGRLPLKMLEVEDNFTGHMNRGAVEPGIAYREAKKRLPNGSESEVQALKNQILEAKHPDFAKQVEREVQNRQFKGDIETPEDAVSRLNAFREQHKWLYAVFPFTRTPAEIAKLAAQRTPFGFVKAAKAIRVWKAAEKKGAPAETLAKLKGEAVDALVRPMMGTAALGAFAAYAKAGGMTGAGPTDRREKSLKRETGWQPYSFVVPLPDGRKAYVPFNRFEPVSTLLGFAADMAEMKDEKSGAEMANKALGSIVSNLSSKTYLQGLADAAEFINDPVRFGGSYLSSVTSAAVPNIVAKVAQGIDPTLRDVTPSETGLAGIPERIGKTLLARVPGASTMLPARMSATGKEITRPGNALSRFASPIQITADRPEAALESLLVESGYIPGTPGREITIPGSGGKKIRLNDSEFRVMQDANRQAGDYLRANQAKLERLKPEERERMVRSIYDRARDNARSKLFKNPTFRSRVREQIAVS